MNLLVAVVVSVVQHHRSIWRLRWPPKTYPLSPNQQVFCITLTIFMSIWIRFQYTMIIAILVFFRYKLFALATTQLKFMQYNYVAYKLREVLKQTSVPIKLNLQFSAFHLDIYQNVLKLSNRHVFVDVIMKITKHWTFTPRQQMLYYSLCLQNCKDNWR